MKDTLVNLAATVYSNWTAWRLGAIVWVVGFLTLELPAHFGWVPWPTLSRTIWDLESEWSPVAYMVAGFFVILLAHLLWRLSAVALIVAGLCIALTLTAHFLWGTP